MAIINTVSFSNNTKEASLNLNAKAFELRRTIAGVWDLASSGSAPPESVLFAPSVNPSGESVIGASDERVLVQEKDINPGGKYRSIVKLLARYEFSKQEQWMMGTGWLISDDTLVTAGHVAYDWSNKLGRAVEVKAYVGYRGRDQINNPNVQFRSVARIVAPDGWLKTRGQKAHDVAFMKLDKPFTGITPIKFEETPSSGNLNIGVVGYPGDLTSRSTGERGAQMYEMFLQTEYDLAQQQDTMLEYQIDTFGGNSGAPVLRQSDLVSIGAHVYGGPLNSASVIGKFGNPYGDYIRALSSPKTEGLSFVEVPNSNIGGLTECPNCHIKLTNTQSTQNGSVAKQSNTNGYATNGISNGTNGTSNDTKPLDTEGFLDLFKKVGQIGGSIIKPILGSPVPSVFLGPAGSAMSIAVGAALNAAGQESVLTESVSSTSSQAIQESALQRAILAESVLLTIQQGQLSQGVEEGIFDFLKDAVRTVAPIVGRVAAPFVPGLGNIMSQGQLQSLIRAESAGYQDAPVFKIKPFADLKNSESFLIALTRSQGRNPSEEGLWDDFTGAISSGVGTVGNAFGQAFDATKGAVNDASNQVNNAVIGVAAGVLHIGRIASRLPESSFSNSESGFSNAESRVSSETTTLLAQRAIIAEAALQAVMKLPPRQLEEEGFFSFLSDTVQKVGRIGLQVGEKAVSAITPGILSATGIRTESASSGGYGQARGVKRKNGYSNGNSFLDRMEQRQKLRSSTVY